MAQLPLRMLSNVECGFGLRWGSSTCCSPWWLWMIYWNPGSGCWWVAPHTAFNFQSFKKKMLSELLGAHKRTEQNSVTKHAAAESVGKHSDSHLVEIPVHFLMMCPWWDRQQCGLCLTASAWPDACALITHSDQWHNATLLLLIKHTNTRCGNHPAWDSTHWCFR